MTNRERFEALARRFNRALARDQRTLAQHGMDQWKKMVKHGVQLRYWPKPIPTNSFDWEAIASNYEPGHPIGYGASAALAVGDLFDQLESR